MALLDAVDERTPFFWDVRSFKAERIGICYYFARFNVYGVEIPRPSNQACLGGPGNLEEWGEEWAERDCLLRLPKRLGGPR